MKVSDQMLNRLKARVEGLLEPEEIRRIRKKLHLTQQAAGLLIGGGPRAFQKYESGDLLPSRAISSALILLAHNPEALDVLKARRGDGESVPYNPAGSRLNVFGVFAVKGWISPQFRGSFNETRHYQGLKQPETYHSRTPKEIHA